ncbi:MAG: hypothetical protein ACI9MR_002224 [Myxococcota bacterium]|jgi:hypothetical protein
MVPTARAYEFYRAETGAPTRWYTDTVEYRLSTVAPETIPAAELPGLFDSAFSAWVDLPGCRTPEIVNVGTTDATARMAPATVSEPSDNVMVFINDPTVWLAGGRSSTWIALTTIALDDVTGELVDTDIEVNDGHYDFATDLTPAAGTPGAVDLLSALTHEAGHFLGLEHSDVIGATMARAYARGGSGPTDTRTLAQDDIDGACALYEVEKPIIKPKDDDCRGGNGGFSGLLAGLLAALAGLLLRRRRSGYSASMR